MLSFLGGHLKRSWSALVSPLGPGRDLPRTCPGLAGVLFVRGPPGAAPRARTRNIVNQLPEILALKC
eukprot:5845124-Pyramimonas_sp.AAC.1